MRFSQPQQNVYFAFFVYAFALGALFPRIGDLQVQMGIGESALGLCVGRIVNRRATVFVLCG